MYKRCGVLRDLSAARTDIGAEYEAHMVIPELLSTSVQSMPTQMADGRGGNQGTFAALHAIHAALH